MRAYYTSDSHLDYTNLMTASEKELLLAEYDGSVEEGLADFRFRATVRYKQE